MIITDKPNDRDGICYTTDPNEPKALVTAEAVCVNLTLGGLYEVDGLAFTVDDFINRIGKRRNRNYDALLVMVDDRGRICVYDSLAQRGGKGLKKSVEIHRFKLFVALMKTMPGLCMDLCSFLDSQVDLTGSDTQATPIGCITSKAARKAMPEWLRKMYEELKPINL